MGHLAWEVGLGADQRQLSAYGDLTARPTENLAGFLRGEVFTPWDRLSPEWRVLLGARGRWKGNP